MKKIFSISIAFLILLSGMHLSVATHICSGEVAAVKWSFSEKEATCGMENTEQTSPFHKVFTSNCCHNKIAVYSVDNDYSPSSYQINEVTKNLLQVFNVPVNLVFHSLTDSYSLFANVIPPGNSISSGVSLADICIFRI